MIAVLFVTMIVIIFILLSALLAERRKPAPPKVKHPIYSAGDKVWYLIGDSAFKAVVRDAGEVMYIVETSANNRHAVHYWLADQKLVERSE